MTSPPPEPYFANGLLQEWWGLHPRAAALATDTLDAECDPLTALNWLEGGDDRDAWEWLRKRVLAELAGARRARERAEETAAEHVNDSISPQHNAGRVCAAEDILEALNAK